jgi:hypothetical protein
MSSLFYRGKSEKEELYKTTQLNFNLLTDTKFDPKGNLVHL